MPDLYISSKEAEHTSPTPAATTEPVNQEQITLKKSEPHLLASFHENPEGVQFTNQAQGEKVLLFLRRHYITNLSWQSSSIVLGILPLLAFAIYPYLSLTISIPASYIIVLVIFYYIVVLGYTLISFVVWFYNVGIISTLRVVDIDVSNINSKDVAAAEIEDIIDVSYKQQGFKQNLFDYGDVYMETQAEKPNFEFIQIPHPARVTGIISGLMAQK